MQRVLNNVKSFSDYSLSISDQIIVQEVALKKGRIIETNSIDPDLITNSSELEQEEAYKYLGLRAGDWI